MRARRESVIDTGDQANQYVPYFGVGVNAMGIFNRLLALTCEDSEDGARRRTDLGALENFVHGIFTKALHGMMLEICCGRFVLRVLETAHPLERAEALACGTLEKVTQSIFVVLDEDVRLEEAVERGTLSLSSSETPASRQQR